jgi:hypothetical protein
MPDPIEQVLQLVADGRLTAAEAAPILDALGAPDGGSDDVPPADERREDPPGSERHASSIRVEVTDGGRKVVNLRIPITLGRLALDRIPGLSGSNADLVRQAIASGRTGTLLFIDDDDGDGVRIALE